MDYSKSASGEGGLSIQLHYNPDRKLRKRLILAIFVFLLGWMGTLA
jgi:hypothetical protein